MLRPKITRGEAIAAIPDQEMADLNKFLKNNPRGSVYVISFRGYYQDSMGVPGQNDRGIYDDCFCVVWPDGYQTFNANTDPSVYRNATPAKGGIATLIPGLHYFKKGNHGISRPGGGYKAFRPATPDESLPVWRDGNTSGKIFRGVAINIHRGGYNSTTSEGCQTVFPDQYNEFQGLVYELMGRYNQVLLPYALVQWEQ